jgi:hypothetical protein
VSDLPERWKEPLNEALWKTDLLFDVPKWTLWGWPIGMALAAVLAAGWPLVVAVAWHAFAMAATQWDSEWLSVIRGWINEPGDIDP